MEKDVLAAADHLRNQLGVFYWTIQRSGDLDIATQQLQTVVCLTERETSPWCLCSPPTVFARWSQLQLILLLVEAKQILKRLHDNRPSNETYQETPLRKDVHQEEDAAVFPYGPLT